MYDARKEAKDYLEYYASPDEKSDSRNISTKFLMSKLGKYKIEIFNMNKNQTPT